MQRPQTVALGGIGSVVVLSGLLLIKAKSPNLLDIPTAWLAVAALPIVVSLVQAGYLKAFKGFGLEIEADLDKPVTTEQELSTGRDPFVATDGLLASDLQGAAAAIGKTQTGRLDGLTEKHKSSLERLTFAAGQLRYVPHAVQSYLDQLPNLKWIEVTDDAGVLLGIIARAHLPPGEIPRFVQELGEGNALRAFPSIPASDAIEPDATLRQVVDALKRSGRDALPVVRDGVMIGAVERAEVERRLGAAVLKQL